MTRLKLVSKMLYLFHSKTIKLPAFYFTKKQSKVDGFRFHQLGLKDTEKWII